MFGRFSALKSNTAEFDPKSVTAHHEQSRSNGLTKRQIRRRRYRNQNLDYPALGV